LSARAQKLKAVDYECDKLKMLSRRETQIWH